jgi:hypothetical protein
MPTTSAGLLRGCSLSTFTSTVTSVAGAALMAKEWLGCERCEVSASGADAQRRLVARRCS